MEESRQWCRTRIVYAVKAALVFALIAVVAIGVLTRLGIAIQNVVTPEPASVAEEPGQPAEGRQADEGRPPPRPRAPWG